MEDGSLTHPIQLSLEPVPPPVDPLTLKPQVIYDYGPSGAPIYHTEKSDSEKLGGLIQRIWAEKGGLEGFTEDRLGGNYDQEDNELEVVGYPRGQDNEEAGTELDLKGMRTFKTDVSQELQKAYQSLSHMHHLLTLLLPPSLTSFDPPHPENQLPAYVPLPASSLSTSLLPPPQAQHALQSGLSAPASSPSIAETLGQKQAEIKRTAELFRKGKEEMDRVCEISKAEWEVALGIKEDGWGIGLIGGGASRIEEAGRTGGKSRAGDWAVWYAGDLAPPLTRHRHVAHLPPTTTSSSVPSRPVLELPAQAYKRLVVSLERTSEGKIIERMCSAWEEEAEDDGQDREGDINMDETRGQKDYLRKLRKGMKESWEEELFNEVLTEARGNALTRPSDLTLSEVTLDVAPGLTLCLTYTSTQPKGPTHPYATYIHAALLRSLLNLHVHRAEQLKARLRPVSDPLKTKQRPKVLGPVLNEVMSWALSEKVKSVVRNYVEDGVHKWGGVGVGEMTDRMIGKEKGASCRVGFEGRRPIILYLQPPSRLTFQKPPASPSESTVILPISDLAHLNSLLELELKDAVLSKAASLRPRPRSGTDDGGVTGFVDGLKGLAVLQWSRGEMQIIPQITFPSNPSIPHLTLKVRTILLTNALDHKNQDQTRDPEVRTVKGPDVWDQVTSVLQFALSR
ncbi:Mediator complex, subunit Med17 [Phaffia rhodozyma]|uniref:Mediator of RNA polymerase II transcription subunit 17 n=1 Tax=Phaffia rhodozyma TaxID=264483 RepID=A0A0F7SUD2_PHARH|nr:Mediator complex, subunit Med17 [Phaffia rhodozyma]